MLIALDAGTTGVRAMAVDEAGAGLGSVMVGIGRRFPRPGWVEQDPAEIWSATRAALCGLRERCPGPVGALGVANQRETALAWDRRSGRPLAPAIVWQDRRTEATCRRLAEAGHAGPVRSRTGLLLDPYFTATKLSWLLSEGGVPDTPDLVLSTVDTWLAWQLTGGPGTGVLVTDSSNASRTLCYDLTLGGWSEELCELFGVPAHALAELRPSCGRIGRLGAGVAPGLEGVPLSALVGDQQAALVGQGCTEPGMAKCTYGTGSFVLTPLGPAPPSPPEGLLASVAWDLGERGGVTHALEGSIFSTGSAIQWLRDGIGIIDAASEIGPLAESVPDSQGAYLVPAFAGLGSPWWDPSARGTLVGLTKGVGRAELARAAIESIAYQVRDVADAMGAAGVPLGALRVDGGASVVDLLLQVQADQLGIPVSRSAVTEATALGAALLAGIAEGVWSDLAEVSALWSAARTFEPRITRAGADGRQAAWRRAVERSRGWARPAAGG
ncbi:MAG: FGGY family carbohydrate kinase [Acidimicrobiales bacterium]